MMKNVFWIIFYAHILNDEEKKSLWKKGKESEKLAEIFIQCCCGKQFLSLFLAAKEAYFLLLTWFKPFLISFSIAFFFRFWTSIKLIDVSTNLELVIFYNLLSFLLSFFFHHSSFFPFLRQQRKPQRNSILWF